MAYETDASNSLVEVLKSYNGYPVYGILTSDDLYNEDTRYTFDITTFIKNELADNIFDYNHAIMLWLYSNYMYSSTDRLVIEAGRYSRNRPKLKIYLMKY